MRRPAAGGMPRSRSAALPNGTKRHSLKRAVQSTGDLVPGIKSRFAARRFTADSGQRYAALHRINDVGQGDGIGSTRKQMPPGDTPNAFDNALCLKQPHDLLNKFFGYAGADRQFGSRGRDVVTLFRKAQQQVQSMTGHCGNTHSHSLFCRR